MHIFKALLLSDLHIAVRPNIWNIFTESGARPANSSRALFSPTSHDPAPLEALARFIVSQPRNRYGAVLIAGDLSTTGDDEDLQAASAFFTSPQEEDGCAHLNAKGKPTVSSSKLRIHLMPGNHDRYQHPSFYPGGERFDRTFTEFWGAGQGIQMGPVLEARDGSERLGFVFADLTLMSADMGDKTYLSYAGQGRADLTRRELLRRATERLRSDYPHTAVIWSIHFAPRFRKDCSDSARLKLLEDEELCVLARDLDVPYIFCGHTHVRDRYTPFPNLTRGPTVICADSACICSTREHTILPLEIKVCDARVVDIPCDKKIVYDERKAEFVEDNW